MKTRWLFNLLQFFSLIFSITIVIFVSYWFALIKHSKIANLNLFVDLLTKSLCFKKLYYSKMLLFFVIVGKILSE